MEQNPVTNSAHTIAPPGQTGRAPRSVPLLVWLAVCAWFIAMSPLTCWGLPGRSNDDLLFGGEPAWSSDRFSAARLSDLRASRGGGADTDLDPVGNHEEPVDLTADENARAAILLRYRLYSRQPDEMITFMALQRMRPRQGDFDPKLYQYGGAYIYLIGGAIGLSSLTGATHLTTQLAYYLDHPADFGAFYVVSRCVSLAFGAAALLAVFGIGRRIAGGAAGWLALLLTAACPVFITLSLEAKPHLPSTALLLWSLIAAWECWKSESARNWVWLGLLSGLAFAFVLTGLAGLILPIALLIRTPPSGVSRWRGPLLAGMLAILVYALLNPYVLINGLSRGAAFSGNLGNSTAMYSVGNWTAGLLRVIELLTESIGPFTMLIGGVSALRLIWRRPRMGLALASPAAGLLLLCIAIGAGKPAEFARFLLLPGILLSIFCAVGIIKVSRQSRPVGVALALVVFLSTKTPEYLHAFAADASGRNESRRLAAVQLQKLDPHAGTLAVLQEPAPYSIPPADLAHRKIELLPPREPKSLHSANLPPILVLTTDRVPDVGQFWWQKYYKLESRPVPQSRNLALITWASKPVFIYRRLDPAP